MLLYLNKDWKDEYGGDFELWDKEMNHCVKKLAPLFNRCIVFSTGKHTFHGHPDPLQCPDDTSRMSIATYYFTEESKPFTRSTEYRARPADGKAKSAMIFTDKLALRCYDFAKRRLGFGDIAASRILKLLSRK